MTAKSGKLNHLSAFRGFEEGGAAAPHLPVSLRKLRETPPSRPENRGGGTPISRPGRLSHCYNSSAHRPRSLFELQDLGSVATNAVKPHLNHPSILLSDGFRSLPERGSRPLIRYLKIGTRPPFSNRRKGGFSHSQNLETAAAPFQKFRFMKVRTSDWRIERYG